MNSYIHKSLYIFLVSTLLCIDLNAALTVKDILGKNELKILKRTKSNAEIMAIAKERYKKLKKLNFSDRQIKRFVEVHNTRQQRILPKEEN